jgi:small subunit ribosomal protein S17e
MHKRGRFSLGSQAFGGVIMGNIRPSFIKSRALRLVETYPDQFTDDFEKNKHLVSEFSDVDNKRMRNWIAGYITRYKQRRVD